jgi:hypothetical protein
MNHTDIALLEVDQLGLLLAQIADLTKQADAIKDDIKEVATLLNGDKVIAGNLYKATVVESNRNTVDYKKLCADLGVTSEQLEAYTKVTAVYAVKVTAR